MKRRSTNTRKSIVIFNKRIIAASIIGLTSSLICTPSQAASEYLPGIPRTAFVKLFEWNWNDIAKECTNFLGPKGVAAVEVSPPQESIDKDTWWARYQPISYKISGRSGSEADFKNMIATCQSAGVDVYVDVVFNQMADPNNQTPANPNLIYSDVPYDASHFHHLGGATSPANCQIQPGDYSKDRWRVMNCDLGDAPGRLPDLDTGNDYVRGKIADYLKSLLNMGVAGFRLDAAKHVHEDDIRAILDKVVSAYPVGDKRRNFFVTQEVIPDGVTPRDNYSKNGTINEFKFVYLMKNAFLGYGSTHLENLKDILPPSTSTNPWGFMASNQAVVFVANWDTARKPNPFNPDSLNNYNNSLYRGANAFMLAWPYGYPMVHSDYYAPDHDAGPPGYALYGPGTGDSPSCTPDAISPPKTWDCVHRSSTVANFYGFRNWVSAVNAIDNWVSDNPNKIAFSRGNRGFVAINNDSTSWSRTFNTGLPAGNYCEITSGERKLDGSCPGKTIRVDSGGNANITIGSGQVAALHIGQKAADVYISFSVKSTTAWGQNLFITGDSENLGSWNVAKAQPCSTTAESYPTWICTLPLPTSSTIEYKFIKKNGAAVDWESGANRTFTTGASPSALIKVDVGNWK